MAAKGQAPPGVPWFERLHPAWVGLVGLVLYLPTLRYGFVRLDDPWLIRDNELLHQLDAASVWKVLADFSFEQRFRLGAEYLPVRDLSVMLDHAIYGDWVGGQHLTQILLYAATCGVLATLALRLFESRALAWLTGLLFATHPVHVEVVAWLSERKGALGALFLCASLLAATSWLRRGRTVYAVAACALFALAVASKALAVAGIAALVLVLLWRDWPVARSRRLAMFGGYAAAGLLVFVPNYLVSRSIGVIVAPHGQGIGDALRLFFETHTQYLRLMAYAGPYAIDYGIRSAGAVQLGRWIPGAIAAAGGVALVAWALLRPARRTAAVFGVAWWLVFLAPVSHLIVPVQNYAADRYLFLPSFGLLLSLAALLIRLPRRFAAPLAAIALLLGVGWTVVQTPVWSSSERLFERAVEVVPSNAAAWDELAALAAEGQDGGRAWALTERGLELCPGDWELLHRQGLLLAASGDLDAAIGAMERAATSPKAHKAYANLALLYLRRGDREDARQLAEQAVRLQADTAHNQRVLGIVAYEQGDREVACRAFERATALDPFNADNAKNLELCEP